MGLSRNGQGGVNEGLKTRCGPDDRLLGTPQTAQEGTDGIIRTQQVRDHPRASQWRCLAIETEGIGELPSLPWGEGLHPSNARGVFPTIILGHTPHREQPCIP